MAMARQVVAVLLIAGALLQADAVGSQTKAMANPVRRVVTMMTNLQKKIGAEAKKKEEMFDKFMCYCKGGDENLKAAISAAEEKIPQLESLIKEDGASKSQLQADVKAATSDRAEAVSTLGKAQAIREKEASEFAAEAAESKTNINALSKAIPAIEQGTAAAFLQTNAGITNKLRQLSVSMDMESVDRDLLASFLSGASSSKGSGEILGILKQMKEEMEKGLSEATADETERAQTSNHLLALSSRRRRPSPRLLRQKQCGLAISQ